mgnify:CR=1 FL=1
MIFSFLICFLISSGILKDILFIGSVHTSSSRNNEGCNPAGEVLELSASFTDAYSIALNITGPAYLSALSNATIASLFGANARMFALQTPATSFELTVRADELDLAKMKAFSFMNVFDSCQVWGTATPVNVTSPVIIEGFEAVVPPTVTLTLPFSFPACDVATNATLTVDRSDLWTTQAANWTSTVANTTVFTAPFTTALPSFDAVTFSNLKVGI